MKKFYVITFVVCLLLVLFYAYGLSLEHQDVLSPAQAEAGVSQPT